MAKPNRKLRSIRLPEDAYWLLKAQAEKDGRTLAQQMAHLVREAAKHRDAGRD